MKIIKEIIEKLIGFSPKFIRMRIKVLQMKKGWNHSPFMQFGYCMILDHAKLYYSEERLKNEKEKIKTQCYFTILHNIKYGLYPMPNTFKIIEKDYDSCSLSIAWKMDFTFIETPKDKMKEIINEL